MGQFTEISIRCVEVWNATEYDEMYQIGKGVRYTYNISPGAYFTPILPRG